MIIKENIKKELNVDALFNIEDQDFVIEGKKQSKIISFDSYTKDLKLKNEKSRKEVTIH